MTEHLNLLPVESKPLFETPEKYVEFRDWWHENVVPELEGLRWQAIQCNPPKPTPFS